VARRRIDYSALPAPLPGESQRGYARRAGVTVSAARVKLGEARGISRAVAVGHARRTGERPLAPPARVRAFFAGVESVKHRRHQGPNSDHSVVMRYSTEGDFDIDYMSDADWAELLSWLDWFDIDEEEYFG
jgi:hypothetical protein